MRRQTRPSKCEKDETGQEVSGTATTDTVSYLMGATGPVYRKDGAGRLNWYVTDGLGSTVAEVDGEGGVIVARATRDSKWIVFSLS